jgi:hypothetical protein
MSRDLSKESHTIKSNIEEMNQGMKIENHKIKNHKTEHPITKRGSKEINSTMEEMNHDTLKDSQQMKSLK